MKSESQFQSLSQWVAKDKRGTFTVFAGLVILVVLVADLNRGLFRRECMLGISVTFFFRF